MSAEPEPWERQPGETPLQFQAFVLYRDAPLTNKRRSIGTVAAAMEMSESRVTRWSRSLGWVDRAGAWDDRQDADWRAEVKREVHRVAQRHGRTARALQGKALEALKALDPRSMTAMEILAYLRQAREIELGVYGDLVEAVDVQGSGYVLLQADLQPASADEPVIVDAEPEEGTGGRALRAIQ